MIQVARRPPSLQAPQKIVLNYLLDLAEGS